MMPLFIVTYNMNRKLDGFNCNVEKREKEHISMKTNAQNPFSFLFPLQIWRIFPSSVAHVPLSQAGKYSLFML